MVRYVNPDPAMERPRGRRRLAAVLVAALFVAVLFAPAALAAGPRNGQGGNGAGGPGTGGYGVHGDRNVDVDVEDHTAQVRSKGAQSGDEIGFQLQATTRMSIEMSYMADGDGTQERLSARVVFRDLVEFNDSNANGLLDEGDGVVSLYDLEDVECQKLEYSNESVGDVQMHTLTARTCDGVFEVVSRIPDHAQGGDAGQSTSWMKLDIMVEGFPFQGNGTMLALRTRLETQARLTIVENSTGRDGYVLADEGVVEFEEDDALGFYSWVRNASVDGSEVRVRTTTRTTEGGVEIDHVYGRGESVIHDPKIGMPSLEEVLEEAFDIMTKVVPYVAGALVGVVIVAATVAARRRQDRIG